MNASGKPPHELAEPHKVYDAPWPTLSLGELAANEPNSITDGPFGSKLKSEHYTESGPRVIRLQNIADTAFVDARAHISEAHYSTLQKHRVFAGDLVIAALGENPPRSCIVPASLGPAIVKADCIRFKAGPRILPNFLNYVLNSPDLRRYAKGIIHGVGRPRLNLGEIKSLPIPVPPLPQQRRIVAEIEKKLTRLDAGVAALRRAQANLKRYRDAVLKAACEGRLVPTEGELATAENRKFEAGDELLTRILNERREKWQGHGKYEEPAVPDAAKFAPLPDGWTWARAEQLCELITKGTTPSASKMFASADEIPFIKVYNLTFSGALNLGYKPVFISRSTHAVDLKRSEVRSGDILINIVGPPLGQVSIVPSSVGEANINQAIARFRVVFPECRKALAIFLMTKHVIDWALRRAKTTAGQSNLTLELCRDLPIPLPPLTEQTRIVAEVERRLSVIKELEAAVSASLKRAARLRQSILQQAFTGRKGPLFDETSVRAN